MAKLLLFTRPSLIGKLIRLRTSSDYDHTELLLNDGSVITSDPFLGVCRAPRSLRPATDIIDLPWTTDDQLVNVFKIWEGHRYDFKGVLLGQLLGAKIQDKLGWFCSELCAECLGFDASWRYSPETLRLTVLEINSRMLNHGHYSL